MEGTDVRCRVAVVLVGATVLATVLTACGSSSTPTWTFDAQPPPTMRPVMVECPPGSTPDEPGPVEQARPPQGSSTVEAFDRRAGRLVTVTGGGEPVGPETPVETWTFDVCTNTWTQMHPNLEPWNFQPLTRTRLIYDVDSDRTLLVSAGRVWAYNLGADTWTRMGVRPGDFASFSAYDPVSGQVVIALPDRATLWTYDVEADALTPIQQANQGDLVEALGPLAGRLLEYDASVDRFIAYEPRIGTWIFDIRTGTWSRSAARTPAVDGPWMSSPTVAYDEAAERTVVFGYDRMAAYDATADRWEVILQAMAHDDGLVAHPDAAIGGPEYVPGRMTYDPVNRRFVGGGDELWAFDLPTHTWSVLLAASEGEPPPP